MMNVVFSEGLTASESDDSDHELDSAPIDTVIDMEVHICIYVYYVLL